MSKSVLLDTNLLIAVFDKKGTTSNEQRESAQEKFNALNNDPSIKLVITPLIRYEVLRGVSWENGSTRFAILKQLLDEFTELDITKDVSELAANLYRYDTYCSSLSNDGRNLEKRKLDVFHLSSAKCNDLELASNDSDIAKLENLYSDFSKIMCEESV